MVALEYTVISPSTNILLETGRYDIIRYCHILFVTAEPESLLTVSHSKDTHKLQRILPTNGSQMKLSHKVKSTTTCLIFGKHTNRRLKHLQDKQFKCYADDWNPEVEWEIYYQSRHRKIRIFGDNLKYPPIYFYQWKTGILGHTILWCRDYRNLYVGLLARKCKRDGDSNCPRMQMSEWEFCALKNCIASGSWSYHNIYVSVEFIMLMAILITIICTYTHIVILTFIYSGSADQNSLLGITSGPLLPLQALTIQPRRQYDIIRHTAL